MAKYKLGILAYGSLIDEPGPELEPAIIARVSCKTPFSVEYARLSEIRGNAPTLVPVKDGIGVNAQILILQDDVTYESACSMLWRRETRKTDTSKSYKPVNDPGPNKVVVEQVKNFEDVETVLYTHIGQNMGILNTPPNLAAYAIQSVLTEAGEDKKDGIHYLINAKEAGIVTRLSGDYEAEILKQTNAESLEEAIRKLDILRPSHLAEKANAKEFEKQVMEIADFISEYGQRTTFGDEKVDFSEPEKMTSELWTQFYINCHTGFKEAQKRVLNLMLGFEDEKVNLKTEDKAAKISRNKKKLEEINKKIKRIEFRQDILHHLMDSIAWQMIGGQLYIARQLYNDVEGEKLLRESNLESLLRAVEQINSEPTDFALISDLTSYIQTGDLLCRIKGQLTISEVKEGARNHEILEILMETQNAGESLEVAQEKHNLDKKSFQQLKRQAKQVETMKNFATIINTDKGIDSATGEQINIITPKEPTHLYAEKLVEIKAQFDKQGLWGYNVVGECLHIGIYKDHFRLVGPKILKQLAESKGHSYILMDYRMVIKTLNQPILYMPFDKKFIFDLLFGRLSMLFLLDFDNFFELYPMYGLKAEWGSRKESHKVREKMGKAMFLKDNKGIKITREGADNQVWLAHGTFLKMIFDSVSPQYIAYSANYNFDQVPSQAKEDS